jgi:hypothetical protein
MLRIGKLLALGAILALPLSPAALADRPPIAEELARIEAKLTELGYTSWEEIEWDDDGYWEVDDAIDASGREFDLKLHPDTLEVIERDD